MRPPAYLRSYLLALSPLALLLLASCESTAPEAPKVTFDAAWAGERWAGEASAMLTNAGVLHIFGSTPVGRADMPSATVTITVEFDGPGTYHLGADAVRLWYLIGGDVISSSYATTTEQTGALIVEEITSTHLRGSVTFDAVSLSEILPVGPQARFEGTFDALLSCFSTSAEGLLQPAPCGR
jgi:hypothetical protein